jgi:PAS domain S-box-containing protein
MINTLDVLTPEFDLIDFFDKTPDFVCIADKAGFFKKINPAVIEKLGYTMEELFSRPISSFVHPDDKEQTSITRAKLLNGDPLLNFRNRYVTKDGRIIWLEWTSIYFADKELVFAIAKDITSRKLIEKEIEDKYVKYKSLANHFKVSMEEDKKYLATELHEQLAQLASVIKFDLDWMKSNVPDVSSEMKDKIEHAFVISEVLINTIQRISFSISPKMLDDLGLDAALEWYSKEFSVLSRIPCRFESDYNESQLTREVKIDFFRICQEALTYILQPAGSTGINISIDNMDERVTLSIISEGPAIDFNHPSYDGGLRKIQDRAASINGQLTLESEEGTGSMIYVSVEQN